jgi:hypothetical protein
VEKRSLSLNDVVFIVKSELFFVNIEDDAVLLLRFLILLSIILIYDYLLRY